MAGLSEGMCPGLDEVLLRGLRAADVKTGQCMSVSVWRLHLNKTKTKNRLVITSMVSCFHSGGPGLI